MNTEQTTAEQRALEAAKNYAKGEWEDNRTSFESVETELVKTMPRPDGGEFYRVKVWALLIDDIEGDLGEEWLELTVHFDQAGHPVFSNVEATRFREED